MKPTEQAFNELRDNFKAYAMGLTNCSPEVIDLLADTLIPMILDAAEKAVSNLDTGVNNYGVQISIKAIRELKQ